jgi:DNA repair protein SbcD/Mre11
MPKFLHTADWHLNALRKLDGYLSRMESTLDQIAAAARSHHVDFVVMAGDVYHTRNISHEERRLFSSWLGALPIPAVVISGNHDKRSAGVGDTSLGYLSSLSETSALQHVICDGLPTLQEVPGARLILLPYQGWANPELHLLLELLVGAAGRQSRRLPLVVVMHEMVHGVTLDSGHTPEATPLRIRIKHLPEVTYWALGDIHRAQAVLPNAWYSGSPHQVNFGEVLPKGILIVDTKKPTEPSFIELESRPLLTLTELPSEVPPDAYIQLRPTKPLGRITLPPNVTLHPTAHSFNQAVRESRSSLGLFDGLDDFLEAAQLAPRLRPLAWRIVKEVGDALGVEVDQPSAGGSSD